MPMIRWFFLALVMTLVACGGSGLNSGGGASGKAHSINWSGIPAEYHPTAHVTKFAPTDKETVTLALGQGIDGTDVVYDAKLAANEVHIITYLVSRAAAPAADLSLKPNDKDLIVQDGLGNCEISARNGQITALKGTCVLWREVVISPTSALEIYNSAGQRLSRRVRGTSFKTLLSQLKQAFTDNDRTSAVLEFIQSHSDLKQVPTLTSEDLGQILHSYAFDDGKFATLRRLHGYTANRSELEAMIDKEFSYFQRNTAREIVGLPARP